MTEEEAQLDEHLRQAIETLADCDKLDSHTIDNFALLLRCMRGDLEWIAIKRAETV